jgi:DNA-binding NarL/FixJ family response regulator
MAKRHGITVLIIDEHSGVSPLLAERLGAVPGIHIVGETANVMLGAEFAHQFEPDIILADFRRTGPPRAETYRWLARISPSSQIVAHTSYLKNDEERALRDAGVVACFLKGKSITELAERLVEVASGDEGSGPRGGDGKR